MQDESTEVDDGFGHWLAGFVDGEGCFTIRCMRSSHPEAGFSAQFTIGLRADDLSILEEIQARTGLGKLYARPARGNSSPSYHWTVKKKAEVRALVAIFDRYPLRAKKASDYSLWREAVIEWCSITCQPKGGRRGPARDWSRIRDLRLALMSGRAYGEQEMDISVLTAPAESADLLLFEEGMHS